MVYDGDLYHIRCIHSEGRVLRLAGEVWEVVASTAYDDVGLWSWRNARIVIFSLTYCKIISELTRNTSCKKCFMSSFLCPMLQTVYVMFNFPVFM